MKILAQAPGETVTIEATAGPKLLDHLSHAGVYVNAACGGAGSCHKCRIQVQRGFLAVSATDRKAFTEAELRQGWRLSCQGVPRVNLEIRVPQTQNFRARPRVQVFDRAPREPYLACDLGSTGVVVAIGDRCVSGAGPAGAAAGPAPGLAAAAHLLNKQVRFGDDVMTRLHAAQTQGVAPLQEALLETLDACLQALARELPEAFAAAAATPLYCAGNSAITTLLNGWDIASLATSPFQPPQRGEGAFRWRQSDVRSLPLLGGFVGGDTLAGLLHLQAQGAPRPWMLVDVGTNTEIVLATEDNKIWFTSAPAGPAFEGGNISCGMRAEPGAIAVARYEGAGAAWRFDTIGGDLPRGVCGSGLMDILWESVQAGLIRRDGFLPGGTLALGPELALNAGDVREFQLAKSATRTGCEMVMRHAGVRPARIYLAGTFAEHLRADSITGVGLLPPGIPFESVGNASLQGVLRYAAMAEGARQDFVRAIEGGRRPLELALLDEFQDAFVRNLDF